MQRVAGLVLGLTASTVAVVTRRVGGECITASQTFTSRGRRDATEDEHRARIIEQAAVVDHAIGPVLLVVVRAPAPVRAGAAGDHGLWWAVLGRLAARRALVAVCDEAEDSATLARLGAVRLGWDVPLERHRDALADIRWPANLTEEATSA